MNKLLYLIAALTLATIIALPTLSAENRDKKLGWCYRDKHCGGDPGSASEVFGYSDDTDLPLYYYYPNCVSFLAASTPYSRMNVCRSENCVEGCDQADTSGDCYSVPDNAPKGASYGCLRQVKQRD